MVIADACLNYAIVAALREAGHEVKSISEVSLGAGDEEVLQIAKLLNGILLTENKNFGEWIFSHPITGLTVMFLRYDKVHYSAILAFLLTTLRDVGNEAENQFTTITKNKVRY